MNYNKLQFNNLHIIHTLCTYSTLYRKSMLLIKHCTHASSNTMLIIIIIIIHSHMHAHKHAQ